MDFKIEVHEWIRSMNTVQLVRESRCTMERIGNVREKLCSSFLHVFSLSKKKKHFPSSTATFQWFFCTIISNLVENMATIYFRDFHSSIPTVFRPDV